MKFTAIARPGRPYQLVSGTEEIVDYRCRPIGGVWPSLPLLSLQLLGRFLRQGSPPLRAAEAWRQFLDRQVKLVER